MIEQVGPYRLLHAIGAGGSARIDLARLDRPYGFHRHVVVKRPLEHLRTDDKARDSLRREARLGGRLRHPNLVSMLDAGVHAGYDYLVLEYVHGGSLRTLMQADEPAQVREVPIDVALTIVRDVARGVHEAHELVDDRGVPLGLVHRDVSPSNVLIGLDGSVKLADFGIAKETLVTAVSASLTGTVTYMAPEQCRGERLDRRADVFALGVILYELLTGRRLFWAENDVASLHRVLEGTFARPREVKPSVPAALDDLVMAALASEPDRRPPTARALVTAIEAARPAGSILAARTVASWVCDVIGPRELPWLGEPTTIDDVSHPPREDIETAPLVDVIRGVRRRSSTTIVMAVAIVAAIVVGGVAATRAISHDDEAAVPSPRPAPITRATEALPTGSPAPIGSPEPTRPDPTSPPAPVTASDPTARPRGKRTSKTPPAPARVPSPRADKPGPPAAAWDEQMLFPSEAGRSTRHK